MYDLTPLEKKEAELEENLTRKNLEWIEEVELVRQIDDLKRGVYGDNSSGQSLKGGWTQEQTASMLGKSTPMVSRQIKLAKVMEARPDLKAVVKNMPWTVADRVIKAKLEAEELERRDKAGQLSIDSRLYCGQAQKLILDVESNSIDLLLTDPPFGIPHISDNQGKDCGEGRSYTLTTKEADNLTEAEVGSLMRELIPELARVLKPGAHFYIFFAFECYCTLMKELSKVFEVNPVPLIWDKTQTTSPFLGYDYAPCSEPILFGRKLAKDRKRLSGAASTIIKSKPIYATKKAHPFEKPSELLEFLIKQSSNVGDLVFDPFAGSGSTLIAGSRLRRNVLGFELDEGHWRSAQSRLTKSIG